ncbi:MAG TPA: SAM-dependent methyltransferase [Candidatus Thermoplasmatota archaeon]|nr:SAM-dependent methyltransferase [Candidatus Thermoplasmatota archaeon]
MTGLVEEIKAEIRREGPMRFDRYMARCLDAYYGRGPAIGPDGDFSTSVRYPAFRDAIARLVAASGMPRVVEIGAGTGALARHVIEALPDVEYWTVDASAGLRAQQASAGARAVARIEEIPTGAPTLVFGNEVLDALPVRRIVGGPRSDFEVYVDLDASGHLRDRLLPCDDRFPGVAPARGQICDVAPDLPAFVRAAARLADPGFLLFIDYGDPAPALYAQTRPNGTLAAYRAHGQNHDWYASVGEQDMTADVDWSAVARAATDAGLEELGLVTQEDLLTALDVDDHELTSPARLGSAFQAVAFRRGTTRALPGF